MGTSSEERILGIDFGLKRVGIAITDPLKMFAYPLTTLINDRHFWSNLDKIFLEYNITKIVLGYPFKDNGEKSDVAPSIDKFAGEISKRYKIDVEFTDERYTSEIAKKRVLETIPSKKKRRDKKHVDKNAAAIILQDYLD